MDTYFSIGFRFINVKIRDASRLGKHGYLGRNSKFTPIVLLDSGHNLENLHLWLRWWLMYARVTVIYDITDRR
jgi:hypothetical protein